MSTLPDKSHYEGFSKLNFNKRLQYLLKAGLLNLADIKMLKAGKGLSVQAADQFVENVIGCFQLPLGVAVHFVIDGKNYTIPMATEETSIIAAASKVAKWISQEGSITTQSLGKLVIGQIQIPRVKNLDRLIETIAFYKESLITNVNNNLIKSLVERGGGLKDMVVRNVSRGDNSNMAIIHVLLDVCDAMGANITNQVCEFLKPIIAQITGETVGLCILSNLSDTKLTQAKIRINQINPKLGQAIVEAALFAQQDPYRAATSNKGVLNGMDAVLIATGNDWRAVEAATHAYAARSGQYRSITTWAMEGDDLVGVLEAPILVGIVGGVTKLHPIARMCLKMLDVKSSEQLAHIIAAVGLVQNLAAIRALSGEGITKGHMRLHTTNLALSVGATADELAILKYQLQEHLKKYQHVTQNDALKLLEQMRKLDAA